MSQMKDNVTTATMISSSHQQFCTLKEITPTTRDGSFCVSSNNKPLNSVNNNDKIDILENRNRLSEDTSSVTVKPNVINSSKLFDVSLLSSSNLLQPELLNRQNSSSEIKPFKVSDEIKRSIISSIPQSIDLSINSRNESALNSEGFTLHKSEQTEKMKSHSMIISPHARLQEKNISDTPISSFSAPGASNASKIANIPFDGNHRNASLQQVFGRLEIFSFN